MPRSGTSWLGQIFASHPDTRFKLDPLFSYAFKDSLDAESSGADWRELFANAYSTADEYMDQDFLRRDGLVPTFDKSPDPSWLVIKAVRRHQLIRNLLEIVDDLRVVLLVRDPRAMIASWLQHPREFPDGADPRTEWRSGSCRKTSENEFWGFDDWLWVTKEFEEISSDSPDRAYLLRYEDLLGDTRTAVESLFSWCGLDLDPQTTDFLTAGTVHDSRGWSVFKSPEELRSRSLKLDEDVEASMINEVRMAGLEHFLDPTLSRAQSP